MNYEIYGDKDRSPRLKQLPWESDTDFLLRLHRAALEEKYGGSATDAHSALINKRRSGIGDNDRGR